MIVVAISGEAPIRRRFQRIEQAPYEPSGFKPNQPFNLPERQSGYYYPKPANGFPEETTTEDDQTTTTESTTAANAKLKEREELAEDLDMGTYYIYHPSGLLQKIVYSTKNDLTNMAYRAEFKYQDVEPIADPIFTYDPNTLALRQVLI